MWACPHCGEQLQQNTAGTAWHCVGRHQFDRAREGYVNLVPTNRKGSRQPGDSPAMMAARRRVHTAGLYRQLVATIESLVSPMDPVANMLDLGCGEGYYSAALQRAQPRAQLYALDISRAAVRLGARRLGGARFAVASSFHLPLRNACLDLVLRVFAPSDDDELRRVLAPGGWYLEVSPAPLHLWELREQLYEAPRAHVPARSLIPGLILNHESELRFSLQLHQELLRDLVAMTPFAHRGHREKRESLLQCDCLNVQMAFALRLFQAP